MRRVIGAILVLVAVTGGVAAGLSWDYHRSLGAPLGVDGTGATLIVERGTPFQRLVNELEAAGILDNAVYLRIHDRLADGGGRVVAGEYRIRKGETARQLYQRLQRGDIARHAVTLVEGWTVREMLAVLHRHPAIQATVPPAEWKTVLGAAFDHPGPHSEGLFFPDTYLFSRNTTDIELLRQAYERMAVVLDEEWQRRADALPYNSPYEALIMASIVETEARLAEEQGRIAGVFVRRLEKGMRLQADPTVVYALGDELDGPLLRVHWRHESPYNTYRIHGLPPTPIGAAGRGAIRAALNPRDGDALYFVSRGDGSHAFSATLEEHNRAVQRYRRGQRGKQADEE